VRASDLFVSHLETSLEPGEWIEEIRLPVRAGGAFEEFARRHGDYALCGVAAIADAFSFVGMGATPVRFVGDVATAVARLEPEDDIHASAAYRRHLALRLAERVVKRA
jgi:carbon-monoxide dehydrogenase medium subunit